MIARRFNKINIIFILGLTLMLLIGALSFVSNIKLNNYNKMVNHTDDVFVSIYTAFSDFLDIETGMRGYVIVGQSTFLEPFDNGVGHIEIALNDLETLTSDNPVQQMRIGQLKILKDQLIERGREQIRLRQEKGLITASNKVSDGLGKKVMDQVREIIGTMEREEDGIRAKRANSVHTYFKFMTLVIPTSTALALILILFALITLNRHIAKIKEGENIVKRLNATLIQKINELENSNRELETFSYSVSHDLRAPLRTMVGFSSIILEDHKDLPEDIKENLGRIVGASQKMGQLIDGLLDLSRLSRKELLSENVNLSNLVDSILKDLRNSDPKRHVNFEIAKDVVVRGDSRLLQSALYNLLNNAWKFTRNSKEARIGFGFKQIDNQKTYYVEDNGVGFDMAYSNKLFGIFQRLHSPNEYEGTGIGLATVQRIIQKHGGKIWVESQVNKGTVFHFTI